MSFAEEHLSNIDGFAFDLDGVIWRGKEEVPGAADALRRVRTMGKQIVFVTNNASQHRKTQQKRLHQMGIEAELDEVITSGYTAAVSVLALHGSRKVFVMGTEELQREFSDAGHQLVTKGANCVVVGFDKTFSYEKLDQAFRNLYQKDCLFVACNTNRTYPAEDGLHPGIGPSVAALACCTNREPDLVVGKPHRPIMDLTLERLNVTAEKCLMVADVLEHDLKGAADIGMKTLFVLSGVDAREDIERSGITPDFVLQSVGEL